MADVVVKKLARDKVRTEMGKMNGYIFSAPNRNEHGQKLNKKDKLRWEMAQYSDPRWAIPERDLRILMEVKRRAQQLDTGHRIGPLKFGQAAIVGLVPLIGDFADILLAYLRVYRKACQVSKGDDMLAFKSKMKVRIVAIGAIGSIPMLGDFVDTLMKFNTQNAASLERLLLNRSGYFEVMAKEKVSKGSWRSRATHKVSHDTLPPPRYDSAHSGSVKTLSRDSSPSTRVQSVKKAKSGLSTKFGPQPKIRGQAVLEAAPQRPSRPENVHQQPSRSHNNYF